MLNVKIVIKLIVLFVIEMIVVRLKIVIMENIKIQKLKLLRSQRNLQKPKDRQLLLINYLLGEMHTVDIQFQIKLKQRKEVVQEDLEHKILPQKQISVKDIYTKKSDYIKYYYLFYF